MNGERKPPYISSPKKSLKSLVLTGSGNSAPESEVGSAGCRGARRNRDVGRPDSKRDHLRMGVSHSQNMLKKDGVLKGRQGNS